jgi:hypothetical protein
MNAHLSWGEPTLEWKERLPGGSREFVDGVERSGRLGRYVLSDSRYDVLKNQPYEHSQLKHNKGEESRKKLHMIEKPISYIYVNEFSLLRRVFKLFASQKHIPNPQMNANMIHVLYKMGCNAQSI